MRIGRPFSTRVGAALLAMGPAAFAHAEVIRVPGAGVSIQDAIDAARNGDVIIVGPGIYEETLDFLGKAITVRSEAGPFETIVVNTRDPENDPAAVVRFMSGERRNSVLEGFTLTGGSGDAEVYGLPVGGGAVTGAGTAPTIRRCVFYDNESDFGGGMFNDGEPLVVNCLFLANRTGFGGGAYNNNADATFVNCTFLGNAAEFGTSLYNTNSRPLVKNSILWEDRPIEGSDPQVTYSDVKGGWSGPGGFNIALDPAFVDADGRIGFSSPCIDAGNNAALQGINLTRDLDGNNRFIDDPDTPPAGPRVDMGAFEYLAICPADVDCDGVVDFQDVVRLLAAWAIGCEGCPEDVNGDGVVDFQDLVRLLANWDRSCRPCGACCLPSTECLDRLTEDACEASQGVWFENLQCEEIECEGDQRGLREPPATSLTDFR